MKTLRCFIFVFIELMNNKRIILMNKIKKIVIYKLSKNIIGTLFFNFIIPAIIGITIGGVLVSIFQGPACLIHKFTMGEVSQSSALLFTFLFYITTAILACIVLYLKRLSVKILQYCKDPLNTPYPN